MKESGETVDTTFDSVAKDAKIHREDAAYGPKFIILGEGWLPKALEDSLVGMDSGQSSTVELPPEKGYGNRDPGKIRLVPLRRFREKGLDAIPGAQIEFDGRPAVVRAVGAGRVQVDYNHPLAGRTLIYDVSIEKVLEDENEKILNMVSRRIPEIAREKFELDRQDRTLTIEVPEEAFYLSGLQVAKKAITSDLQKYFPELDSISFRETFKRAEPKVPSQEESSPQEGQETSPEATAPQEEKPAEIRNAALSNAKPLPTKRAANKTPKRRPRAGSENQR